MGDKDDIFFRMSLDLLCVAGVDGYFKEINPAFSETLGWSTEELQSKPFLDFIHPDDLAATLAEVEKLSQGVTTIRFQNRYATRSGGWRWLAWTSRPDPETGLLYAIARDVTHERELTDALSVARDAAEHANLMKSQFLANMSHELRTPLNAIIGYSEMLVEEAEDEGLEGFTEDLGRIRNAGRHLLELINQVLDLSKIEAGRMEVVNERVELAGLVESLHTTTMPLAAVNNNQVTVHLAPGLAGLTADPTKLKQVLLNLLANACKFTSEGEISLRVTTADEGSGPKVLFAVHDTGIGMNEEELQRVFEPFSQADASTTRRFGGTGLGLSISRKLCELMGGALTARSTPSEGSVFTATLPADAVSDAAEPVRVPDPLMPAGGGDLVLVIDDDLDARTLLTRMLESHAYRVVTAATAEDGLRLARQLKPHAITLDLLMPEKDGWSTMQAFKEDPELQDIAVIVVSMLDENPLAYALGAEAFLTKPVDRHVLDGAIQKALNGARPGGLALLLEDDEVSRDLTTRSLQAHGWEVVVATDGADGLKRLRERRPAIVVLDLMMPGMDGFEFLDEMQDHPEWADIPVVVLTAVDIRPEDRERLGGRVKEIMRKSSVTGDTLARKVRNATMRTDRHQAVELADGEMLD